MSDESEDSTLYRAVESGEGQYSIWPADRALPPGWRDSGKSGPRAEVMAWIEMMWIPGGRPS